MIENQVEFGVNVRCPACLSFCRIRPADPKSDHDRETVIRAFLILPLIVIPVALVVLLCAVWLALATVARTLGGLGGS